MKPSCYITLNDFLSNVVYFVLAVAVTLFTQKTASVENKEIRLSFSSCLGRGDSLTNSVRLKSGCSVLFHGMSFFYISNVESFSKSLNLLQNYRHLRKPNKLERVVPVAILGERLFVIIRDFMKCFWTKGL